MQEIVVGFVEISQIRHLARAQGLITTRGTGAQVRRRGPQRRRVNPGILEITDRCGERLNEPFPRNNLPEVTAAMRTGVNRRFQEQIAPRFGQTLPPLLHQGMGSQIAGKVGQKQEPQTGMPAQPDREKSRKMQVQVVAADQDGDRA